MHRPPTRLSIAAALLAWSLTALHAYAQGFPPSALRDVYAQRIDRQLSIPPDEQRHYAALLTQQLTETGHAGLPPQYVLLVDRNPQVQAILLFWLSEEGQPELIGASPVSTGREGHFMYYETPLGVYDHSLANPDFRAEGTENSQGIMGYGVKGMRVYDFGWVPARRTWRPGTGIMRLQMHATDPRSLEKRLGTVQSMGCIRIPATLNRLLDHYGLLDADYEGAIRNGRTSWVLPPDRESTGGSGRYLVIVDTGRATRPDWSPIGNPAKGRP